MKQYSTICVIHVSKWCSPITSFSFLPFFIYCYYSLIVEKDLSRNLAYPERRAEPCLMLYKKRAVFWVWVKFIFSFCIYGDLVFQWILLCNNRPVSCFPYLFFWAVSWLSCDLIWHLNSRIYAWYLNPFKEGSLLLMAFVFFQTVSKTDFDMDPGTSKKHKNDLAHKFWS